MLLNTPCVIPPSTLQLLQQRISCGIYELLTPSICHWQPTQSIPSSEDIVEIPPTLAMVLFVLSAICTSFSQNGSHSTLLLCTYAHTQ